MATEFHSEPRTRLQKVPADANVIFGLFLENHIFRVVRIESQKSNPNNNMVTVKLIDVGEEVEIACDSENMYALSPDYVKIPAQAIRFRLVMVMMMMMITSFLL